MFKSLWLTLFGFLMPLLCFATHNRAGEITYEQIGPQQFKIRIVTYTRIASEAERPYLELNWGDGTRDSLSILANYPQPVANDIEINIYEGIHTFPGPGIFTLSLEDPNRNEGVLNVPNSVNTPFYLETTIIVNPFLGTNSSPTLLNPPIETACVGAPLLHNPSAFDPDGDSLVYTLVTPKGANGEPVGGYFLPAGVTIDEFGTLLWDAPTITGEFNFAILIEEYRNGIKIGDLVRDMQVTVGLCDNSPPVILPMDHICIEAGQTIHQTVKATDPDNNEVIFLSASGGVFNNIPGNTASFPSGLQGIDSVSGIFTWNTECVHVSTSPYQVTFRAEDNDADVPLIDLSVINITVIGPETENLSATATLSGIELAWDANPCTNISGYAIYRKIDSTNWQHDTCETGVPTYTGYSFIQEILDPSAINFIDSNTVPGHTYCYRIVALFPDGAESYSSIEVCAEPLIIQPVPTHASVLTTDGVNGKIDVRWSAPKDLDSIVTTGNLFYELFRIENGTSTLIYTSNDLIDTNAIDSGITTDAMGFTYQVNLVSSTEGLISSSEIFTSTFTTITESDRTLILNWTYNTPWENDSFIVYKESFPNSGIFTAIDTVFSASFTDQNLINGTTYCYYIETFGGYSADEYAGPYRNNSQYICGTPLDTIPPCAPEIVINSNCEGFSNTISWEIQVENCNADMETIKIWQQPFEGEAFEVIFETTQIQDTSIIFENLTSVAGCFGITAIDSNNNESILRVDTCLENCPVYILPNIFTPNGDGINDFVFPIESRYIDHIELTIYNRWGETVFKTNQKGIDWDGKNIYTNLNSSVGVYYFVCKVYPIEFSEGEPQILNGFIQLLR